MIILIIAVSANRDSPEISAFHEVFDIFNALNFCFVDVLLE